MKGFGLASLLLLGSAGILGQSGPQGEPKGEEDVHHPKGVDGAPEPDQAMVQPVAILMDNGDVVPLPVGHPEHGHMDEMMDHMNTVAAQQVPYMGAYGYGGPSPYMSPYMSPYYAPPQMAYSAYPQPGAPPAMTTLGEPDFGRVMTQRSPGYGYGAQFGGYGGYETEAFETETIIPGPGFGGKGFPGKGFGGKGMYGKGFPGKGFKPGKGFGGKKGGFAPFPAPMPYPIVPEIETPIIEQPIYRPSRREALLYDSRISQDHPYPYNPVLPSHISCPKGVNCTAKSYYVPTQRPIYPQAPQPMPVPRPTPSYKTLKKAAYGKRKYGF